MSKKLYDIGGRIKAFRLYKELSSEHFAKSIGISRKTQSSIENHKVSKKILDKILTTYPELSPSWLKDGKGKMILEDIAYLSKYDDKPGSIINHDLVPAQIEIKGDEIDGLNSGDYICSKRNAIQIELEAVDDSKLYILECKDNAYFFGKIIIGDGGLIIQTGSKLIPIETKSIVAIWEAKFKISKL